MQQTKAESQHGAAADMCDRSLASFLKDKLKGTADERNIKRVLDDKCFCDTSYSKWPAVQ